MLACQHSIVLCSFRKTSSHCILSPTMATLSPNTTSENHSKQLAQMNAILSHLANHDDILKLCKTVLSNIVKDPSNPKFQSLNDTKLASKCGLDPDQYLFLTRFLKQIGFQRQTTNTPSTLDSMSSSSDSQCRWIFNPNINPLDLLQQYLTMTLTQINTIQHQQALSSETAIVYPPKLGDLAMNKVSFWAKAQKSVDNFWSGSSWGNYHCVLIISNFTRDSLSVHWINRCGIERKEGTIVEPRKTVTIFAQLNHPHVIKRKGNALYGIMDEYLIGYNPTVRGISNNGYHVIFVGAQLKAQQIQTKALELIQKAPADKRVKPTMSAAPRPPRPEDRKGKFYGGR